MGGVLGGKERDKCCNYISKIIAKPCYPCQKPQNQSKTKQNLQTNKQTKTNYCFEAFVSLSVNYEEKPFVLVTYFSPKLSNTLFHQDKVTQNQKALFFSSWSFQIDCVTTDLALAEQTSLLGTRYEIQFLYHCSFPGLNIRIVILCNGFRFSEQQTL